MFATYGIVALMVCGVRSRRVQSAIEQRDLGISSLNIPSDSSTSNMDEVYTNSSSSLSTLLMTMWSNGGADPSNSSEAKKASTVEQMFGDSRSYSRLSHSFASLVPWCTVVGITVLLMFVCALPSLISLVKRPVEPKIVLKTYEVAAPNSGGLPTIEQATNIVTYFQAHNYKVTDASGDITFQSREGASIGQAVALSACTFFCLAALALGITMLEKQLGGGSGLGDRWYVATMLSPIAGKYYMANTERIYEVSVKLIEGADDNPTSDIIISGDQEVVERCRKTLDWHEKAIGASK